MIKLKRKILFILALCMMVLTSLGNSVPTYATNNCFEGPSYTFDQN